MSAKKSLWVALGFLLAGTGFMALVLSLIGVKLSFLTWIDAPGALFGFVLRLVFIITGIIIVYLNLSDFSGNNVR